LLAASPLYRLAQIKQSFHFSDFTPNLSGISFEFPPFPSVLRVDSLQIPEWLFLLNPAIPFFIMFLLGHPSHFLAEPS